MSDYEHDFHAWTQEQAEALRAKEWKTLDVENLAEEIESLGRSERYTIESHLQNLLTHLRKRRDDPATEPRRGWRLTIRNARREIAKRARGRLGDYPAQYLATAYRDACEDVADETDLALTTFPPTCPWSVEQVLDANVWPEAPPRAVGPRPRGPQWQIGPGRIGSGNR
jgi:hypothetical protein